MTSLNRALAAIASPRWSRRGGRRAGRLLRHTPSGPGSRIGLLIRLVVRRHRPVRVVAPAGQPVRRADAAVGFAYCSAR